MRTALYRHFDSAGELLYVGITDGLGRRDSQHCAGAGWASSVHETKTEWFENRADARRAETRAIMQEDPLHNKQGRAQRGDTPAARVVRLRSLSGLTQAEFAKRIDVKRSRLSQWEGGVQNLSLTGALALHREFGASLDWLFLGEGSEPVVEALT